MNQNILHTLISKTSSLLILKEIPYNLNNPTNKAWSTNSNAKPTPAPPGATPPTATTTASATSSWASSAPPSSPSSSSASSSSATGHSKTTSPSRPPTILLWLQLSYRRRHQTSLIRILLQTFRHCMTRVTGLHDSSVRDVGRRRQAAILQGVTSNRMVTGHKLN